MCLSTRYKLVELLCYVVMGFFPALVVLSMVSPEPSCRALSEAQGSAAAVSVQVQCGVGSQGAGLRLRLCWALPCPLVGAARPRFSESRFRHLSGGRRDLSPATCLSQAQVRT